jgi:hypothetical protein
MMNTTYTPGKWYYEKQDSAHKNSVIYTDKKVSGFANVYPGEHCQADAKLMAAAPELLKCLNSLVNICQYIPKEVFTESGKTDLQYILNACGDAILKATY